MTQDKEQLLKLFNVQRANMRRQMADAKETLAFDWAAQMDEELGGFAKALLALPADYLGKKFHMAYYNWGPPYYATTVQMAIAYTDVYNFSSWHRQHLASRREDGGKHLDGFMIERLAHRLDDYSVYNLKMPYARAKHLARYDYDRFADGDVLANVMQNMVARICTLAPHRVDEVIAVLSHKSAPAITPLKIKSNKPIGQS